MMDLYNELLMRYITVHLSNLKRKFEMQQTSAAGNFDTGHLDREEEYLRHRLLEEMIRQEKKDEIIVEFMQKTINPIMLHVPDLHMNLSPGATNIQERK